MHLLLKIYTAASRLNGKALAASSFIFFLFSSCMIHVLEPDRFPTVFKGFWWTVVTAATVGYGDYYPVTVPGMALGIFVIFTGLFLIGAIVGRITEQILKVKRSKEEGRLPYTKEDHYVLIGWSEEKSRATVEELLQSDPKRDVVLIDRLAHAPFSHVRFHYVQGDPTMPETLAQARVERCSSVIVFAPVDETDPLKADGQTLMIATSIEHYGRSANADGRDIYTIVEIVKAAHERNFAYANVDEFILSQQSTSHMMAKSSLHKGASQLFMQLLSDSYGEDLREIAPRGEWQTYGEAFEALKREGANLIADRKDLSIIRKLDEPLPRQARLFVICNDATFARIRNHE
ncbi:potassium channel family protein [Paenibacillus aurantiacus]|uniref:Potassium channel family protein n=1 Tax=Paenibacillus aurantiacus TaxID=1936118 RepID=A0ABV5KUA8_9BACL